MVGRCDKRYAGNAPFLSAAPKARYQTILAIGGEFRSTAFVESHVQFVHTREVAMEPERAWRAMYDMGGAAYKEIIKKDRCCRRHGKFMVSPKVAKNAPHIAGWA